MALFSSQGGVSWIIVFLGNPGLQYNGTRHNAGFMVCDVLEKRLGISVNRLKNRALTAKVTLNGVFVNGKGYGSATVKNMGAVPVTVGK